MEKLTSKTVIKTTGKKPGQVNTLDSLTDLRDHIDDIDRELVDLLVKRQEVINRVASIKNRHNMTVYHPAREEDIISDRRNRAKDRGLDPDYLEELFRIILRRSRLTQTDSTVRKSSKPGRTVLLVGGTGSMGSYFHNLFRNSGYKTRVLGSRDWPEVDTLCEGIDLALISVPINVTVEIIENIAPHLPPDCVLADLTSIKEEPVKAMLEYHKGPVIGLHPMFGPTVTTMDKQIVVSTPGRYHDACKWLYDQFVSWGALVMESDAEEHDRIMSVVQALRHFASFAFGRFILRHRVDLNRTIAFSSPIYRLELAMVGRLFAQDPSLYSEIIFASPERLDMLKDYVTSLQDNLWMIEKGDKQAFEEQFRQIADWFGPFSEQAMRESGFLIDKLIERF